MTYFRLCLMSASLFVAGCTAQNRPAVIPQPTNSPLAFVWAGDPDSTDSDFLAVIDVDPNSSNYGTILTTVPVGVSGMAHHTEHRMSEGRRLVANSFAAGQTFIFNVQDPRNPFVERSFAGVGDYTYPHSFERTPSGNILATFQTKGEGNRITGGLVEMDTLGNPIRSSDASDPDHAEIRVYSLGLVPDIDRVVTTTSDMNMQYESSSIQIWSLSGLELLHTVPLPTGPNGFEHLDPAEPRVLEDGRTVMVNTFRCGLYVVTGLETDAPAATLVDTFPFESSERGECAVPIRYGSYWIQTVEPTGDIVSLDVTDPMTPIRVDTVSFGAEARPHWISIEPGGGRILMTGYGSLAGWVYIVTFDPDTGRLALDETFREPGSDTPGVSFLRDDWPHGETGSAHPHGAVFSR